MTNLNLLNFVHSHEQTCYTRKLITTSKTFFIVLILLDLHIYQVINKYMQRFFRLSYKILANELKHTECYTTRERHAVSAGKGQSIEILCSCIRTLLHKTHFHHSAFLWVYVVRLKCSFF